MHHVVLEQWTRRSSAIHSLDPRAKLTATLLFLLAVATTPLTSAKAFAGYAILLLLGVAVARLPLLGIAWRAGVVFLFAGLFALISLLSGDPQRATTLLVRSYLSTFAVLLLAGTTLLPVLLRGMERLGAPSLVILVIQFLYRYLFVISQQGQHMRQAAVCRGGQRRAPPAHRMRAAAGAVAVLFGRSYQRAEGIHHAMLARLYQGHLILAGPMKGTWRDVAFLFGVTTIIVALRFPFWV